MKKNILIFFIFVFICSIKVFSQDISHGNNQPKKLTPYAQKQIKLVKEFMALMDKEASFKALSRQKKLEKIEEYKKTLKQRLTVQKNMHDANMQYMKDKNIRGSMSAPDVIQEKIVFFEDKYKNSVSLELKKYKRLLSDLGLEYDNLFDDFMDGSERAEDEEKKKCKSCEEKRKEKNSLPSFGNEVEVDFKDIKK